MVLEGWKMTTRCAIARWIFHGLFGKNDTEMNKGRTKNNSGSQNYKNAPLLTQTSARNVFWDDFWLASGPQSDTQKNQKGIKKATVLRLAARSDLRRPQGRPMSHLQYHLCLLWS